MSLETQTKTLENVKLNDDENIEGFIRRHWVVLLPKITVPVLLALGSLGLFGFRAIGGGFIASNTVYAYPFDAVNLFLAFLLVVLALLFVISQVNSPESKRFRRILIVVGILIAGVFAFRYGGGRLLYIDSALGSVQLFDFTNKMLLVLAVVGLLLSIYMYIEWYDDYLILTNQRVISWHQVLLGRHSESQIYIDDIQSVNAQRASYTEYWLDYGTVTITSASFRRNVTFSHASKPAEIQKAIMAKVNAIRGAQNFQNFQELLQKKVYTPQAPPKPPPPQSVEPTKDPFFKRLLENTRSWLAKLREENPHIEGKNITWRPHWIFIPVVLLKPTGFLIVGFTVLILVSRFFVIGWPFILLTGLALMLVFLAWAAYVVEDERNEEYILTPATVIDVEKKPFGPEGRNVAGLDKLQNVTAKTTFISRIFGYGDVVMETAGGGAQFTFHRLPKPQEVVAKINEYRVEFKKAERERSLNETLSLLHHYHDSHIQNYRDDHQQYLKELLSKPLPESGSGS